MAVKGDTVENEQPTSGAAPGVEHPTTHKAPGYHAPPGESRLLSSISRLSGFSSLGAPIEEYIKNIKSYFVTETGSPLTNIEVRRLDQPNGAYAFVYNKVAIIMLFQEALRLDSLNFIPVSDQTGIAVAYLKRTFGEDTRFINAVVVLPNDYSRAQIMAQYISSSLAVAAGAADLDTTIAVFTENNYLIDPDVVQARQFIDVMNPSSVAPRTDIGFVIYAKQQRRMMNSAIGQTPDETIPIAAVGAYTEMLERRDAQSGMIKYLPMVHVTSIVSALPVPGMIALCLAVAADQFISTGRWIQQFQSFQKNKPNLGQLSEDPNDRKKLWFAANPSELDGWRLANCLQAVLAVDVAEGTARIPALAVYGSVPKQASVYDQIAAFFGNRIPLDRNRPPYIVHASDYIGVYGDVGGTLVDSRNMDYVSLLAIGGAQDMNSRMLLGYPQDPSNRARIISEKTGGQFRSLYRNTISVLDPALLQMLAQIVQQSLQIESPAGQNKMNPTDWMTATTQAYQQYSFGVSRAPNTVGGYNTGALYNI